jgi:putative SOS response-associated peptidase YedK
LRAFKKLFERRAEGAPLIIPKGMEANFLGPGTTETAEIAELILAYHGAKTRKLEAELAKQRERLDKAKKALRVGETAKLLEEQRIAGNKIAFGEDKIADLKRRQPERRDARVFPQHYAPVVIEEGGERVIRPMRYLLRRAGKPASEDRKFSGCYNARRDNLDRFWKEQFGHDHGIIVVTSFYENVSRHKLEHRELESGEGEENVVLQFDPRPAVRMRVACLWSHWIDGDAADLLSFAAVTDEPPPEIAEAGHDRCIVPISDANLDAWLSPEGLSSKILHEILEQRERPYYEHRIAA